MEDFCEKIGFVFFEKLEDLETIGLCVCVCVLIPSAC